MEKLYYELRPFLLMLVGLYAAKFPNFNMELYAGVILSLTGVAIVAMRITYRRQLRRIRSN